MKTLRFSGSSDDTFGEWTTGVDWDNCASGKPITFKVTAGGHSLYVTGQYSRLRNACWDVSVCRVREGDSCPAFSIRASFEAYSTVLEMDVPDDVRVIHMDEGEIGYDMD